jgi:hypothetical protein
MNTAPSHVGPGSIAASPIGDGLENQFAITLLEPATAPSVVYPGEPDDSAWVSVFPFRCS